MFHMSKSQAKVTTSEKSAVSIAQQPVALASPESEMKIELCFTGARAKQR